MVLENLMIHRKTIAALILAAALASGAARAADLPYAKAAPPYAATPAFSWTGFYAGLNVGGGFGGENTFNSFQGTTNGRASGGLGGIQVGYNYQLTPRFVVGIENDFLVTGIKAKDGFGNEVSLPFLGTGRARAGMTFMDSQLLLYGTGGLAFGQVKDPLIDKMRIGWTAGGGVEWAFRSNWSAKLEYLYTDLYRELKKNDLPEREQKLQTITVGLNYHF
ncbi:outer membrane beta-barrel protein [soil metagenome]